MNSFELTVLVVVDIESCPFVGVFSPVLTKEMTF